MLLALVAGSALGSMPLPQFAARTMDVSQASVLAATTAPMVTWADLFVDLSGRVDRCTIVVSSGSSLADRTACERAERMARFAPARDESGRPVAALVRQGFAVNRALPAADVDFALVVDRAPPGAVADLRIVADAAGKVETCAIETSSSSAPLDRAGCAAVTGVARPVVLDAAGAPVRAMSRVSVGFSTRAVSPK
jgi:TonB family protein